jgi:hypothetical protein
LRDSGSQVRGRQHARHERGPDDDAVSEAGHLRGLRPVPYSQADRDRQAGVQPRTRSTSPAAPLPTAALAPVMPISEAA